MSTDTLQDGYTERFLCVGVPFFNKTFDTNYQGIGSFKRIQDRLEDFATIIQNELLIHRRHQPLHFQNDSGVYHQRAGYPEYESRYDQFEIVLMYSEDDMKVSFTQGDETIEVEMKPKQVYMVNNQIEHVVSTNPDNNIVMFCFEGSYMEIKRWLDILKKHLT